MLFVHRYLIWGDEKILLKNEKYLSLIFDVLIFYPLLSYLCDTIHNGLKILVQIFASFFLQNNYTCRVINKNTI